MPDSFAGPAQAEPVQPGGGNRNEQTAPTSPGEPVQPTGGPFGPGQRAEQTNVPLSVHFCQARMGNRMHLWIEMTIRSSVQRS